MTSRRSPRGPIYLTSRVVHSRRRTETGRSARVGRIARLARIGGKRVSEGEWPRSEVGGSGGLSTGGRGGDPPPRLPEDHQPVGQGRPGPTHRYSGGAPALPQA